ncbi:phage tail sheath C-terminal domain-containing protein [Aquimarina sp. AU474]|uniref:phage tail sheath family protein n=1 Tax=Aquimarina sp. AU474 TaxID=2108529 RepID=UPI000D6889DE
MATYSTPGVYIEEIAKFPPSVAQVETAIPAFIGYTQKATNKTEGDLNEIPTRITSMLEYETFFGLAELEKGIDVEVVEDVISVKTPTTKSPFLMYYSLQLYFANGGGPCYILSVGQYGEGTTPVTAVTLGSETTAGLAKGLKLLEKEDEPTLIVFPDATSLAGSGDFYGLYKSALIQCNKLQDRFAIIDTYSYDNSTPVDTNIKTLRDGIDLGKDFIKYGGAYYPFVETILDYRYEDQDVDVDVTPAGKTADEVINEAKKSFTEYVTQIVSLKADVSATTSAGDAIALKPALSSLIDDMIDLATDTNDALTTLYTDAKASTNADVAASGAILETWVDTNVKDLAADLTTRQTGINDAATDTKTKILGFISTGSNNVYGDLGVNETTITSSTILVQIDALKSGGDITTIKNGLGDPKIPGKKASFKLYELETQDNALFNRVKAEIGQLPIILPPSSGMAGVYARTDSTRGVWKAPANVGMNYVIKPTVHISHEEQESLNVHETGKSINAIRTFSGKGTLVWGARTLAGNDNEWRYVSVRRFFNMAEESIKKASEQFVFEPNDANTWVKVKAMITNFLNLQWRAGALAGPTPDKAFYVNVGLGETMTAQDVLEGYMIVEIGMAVVRPAEFIILKFSHKMQEA